MAEVVVYGVPAADIVCTLDTVPLAGEHINAEPIGWRLGGSAANLACALSSAGHRVTLVGSLVTDALGKMVVAQLNERGVVTDQLRRVNGATARALILI